MKFKENPNWQPRKSRFKHNKAMLYYPSLEGWSYDWWQVTRVIDGVLVFNEYKYSPTTTTHQSLISNWLSELGVKIGLSVNAPEGLQRENWIEKSLRYEAYRIGELRAANAFGKPSKNAIRNKQIVAIENRMKALTQLEYFSKRTIQDILLSETTRAQKDYNNIRNRKIQERKDKKLQNIINKIKGVAC